MGATITTHKQALAIEEYVKLMSSANSNLAKGGVDIYISAELTRRAAQIAKSAGNDMLKDAAAIKSYWQFMSLKQSDLVEATFRFGNHIHVYKCYERAADVADENGLSSEMKISAAKKAVSCLIEDVKSDQPHMTNNYGSMCIISVIAAAVNLSEAERIVKKFGLGHEESDKVKEAIEEYKTRVVEQIVTLIRKDYADVREIKYEVL